MGLDRLLPNGSDYGASGAAGSASLYDEMAHDPGAWGPRVCGTVPTVAAVAQAAALIRLATGVAPHRSIEVRCSHDRRRLPDKGLSGD
ncbi:hypothetical protein GCM10015535_62420 [Streptomyces gelaticus]|uniref:Uncharacterized protein n=1 Tax=Streptomyces gelaticus TaxID=285446 RepID=A0ABQ2WA76_9ACTN|nr:hypothetical protein [Streptomyces gelaticus]GGV95296.1 hypothetical protein GCM10015535_62420 [Streptomyces gelaticus]